MASHELATTFELDWGSLTNGELLAQAEAAGFKVLVTTDQNLRYQQNLKGREIAIVVLSSTSWPRILRVASAVSAAVDSVVPGGYHEVRIP